MDLVYTGVKYQNLPHSPYTKYRSGQLLREGTRLEYVKFCRSGVWCYNTFGGREACRAALCLILDSAINLLLSYTGILKRRN